MLIVLEQGKVSTQLDDRGKFPVLLKSFADRVGSNVVYGEHAGILDRILSGKAADYRKIAEAVAALTPERYRVTQQGGTERPDTGARFANQQPDM